MRKSLILLVGARGFEPPTPASRTRCATGLRYAPITTDSYALKIQRCDGQSVDISNSLAGQLAFKKTDAFS